MRSFTGFTKRNLLLYFKDKQAILFSVLTSIIVFVLYLLFLKQTFVDGIEGSMNGLENFIDPKDIDILVNGQLLTGIIGSALITVPFNCLTTVVADRETGIDYDISATPMKRWKIALSYFVSSTVSAFIVTSFITAAGLLIMALNGGLKLSFKDVISVYGIIFLGAVSATAFFMIVVLFFKSSSACGAFFGMLSAAVGFVIGAYIPVSQFSEHVQTFCNLFPASHVTSLFRNVLLSGTMDSVNESIGGVDSGLFVSSVKDLFSFRASMFGERVSSATSVLYVICATAVFAAVMVFAYYKTYKRK